MNLGQSGDMTLMGGLMNNPAIMDMYVFLHLHGGYHLIGSIEYRFSWGELIVLGWGARDRSSGILDTKTNCYGYGENMTHCILLPWDNDGYISGRTCRGILNYVQTRCATGFPAHHVGTPSSYKANWRFIPSTDTSSGQVRA